MLWGSNEGTAMGHEELKVRRERREWLLRVCSQALQRQQAGRAAGAMAPVRTTATWAPVPGWSAPNGCASGVPALAIDAAEAAPEPPF